MLISQAARLVVKRPAWVRTLAAGLRRVVVAAVLSILVVAAALMNVAVASAGPDNAARVAGAFTQAVWQNSLLLRASLFIVTGSLTLGVAGSLALGAYRYWRSIRVPLSPAIRLPSIDYLAVLLVLCAVALNVGIAVAGVGAVAWIGKVLIWHNPLLQATAVLVPIALAMLAARAMEAQTWHAFSWREPAISTGPRLAWDALRQRPMVLLAALAAWLLLLIWLVGLRLGPLAFQKQHDALGLQLTAVFGVTAIFQHWTRPTLAAGALMALLLCPITQIASGSRLAEELAIFAYFALCLAVARGIWDSVRQRERDEPSETLNGLQANRQAKQGRG